MSDRHRLCRGHFIQVVPVGMAAKQDVVVSISADHLARRSDRSLLLQGGHKLIDRLDPVAAQPHPVIRRVLIEDRLRVQVRVIEPRGHCLTLEVNYLGRCHLEFEYLRIRSNGGKPSIVDGKGLRGRVIRIYSDDLRVDHDGVSGKRNVR